MVNLVAQIFLCTLGGVFIVAFGTLKDSELFYTALVYASSIYLLVLTMISLFSMWHIQQSSNKLEQIGISANKALFTVYVICWFSTFLGFSSSAILSHIS